MESWRGNTFKAVCPFFKKRWIYRHQFTICQWKWCWLSSIWSDEKIAFFPTPTKPRYFVLGGSAALGQQGVDIKVSINWPTEKLGQGVSVLPEKLSLSGRIRSLLSQQKRN